MTVELLLVAVGLVAIWRTHHLAEFHHLYLGLLVAFWSPLVGWIITADDVAQHWCEWLPPSPLHWLYAYVVGKVPVLGWLGAEADLLVHWLASKLHRSASTQDPSTK